MIESLKSGRALTIYLFKALLGLYQRLRAKTKRHQPARQEDIEFGNRAYNHVINLCSFGERVANSRAEEQTIQYIRQCFTDIGMTVKVDSFEFTSFESVNREVLLNGSPLFFRSLYLNRLQFRDLIEGQCVIADCGTVEKRANWRGKIVLTDRINDILYLKDFNPEAVLVLRREDFGDMQRLSGREISISIPGQRQDKASRTYNVIAQYVHTNEPQPDRDIIISAHWDSKGGSGAKDNASGVATMIELARGFKASSGAIPYNLIFIATGAEELGFLGSIAHIVKYSTDLRRCDLAINVDGVGDGIEGIGRPYLSMTAPGRSWKRKGDTASVLHLVSTDNYQSAWLVSGNDLYWNSPTVNEDWISEKVSKALAAESIKFVKGACCSGADVRSFAFIGVPTIHQGYVTYGSRDVNHTEEDVPNESFRCSLSVSGKVTSLIVMAMIENRNVH